MRKRIIGGAVATLVIGAGLALADGTLRAPPGLNAPGSLNAVGAGLGECPVPACDPADADCGQAAFEAAVTCLQLGVLDTCEDCLPPPDTTFFVARGHGVTLIGAVGQGSQRQALRGLQAALRR